MSEHLMPQHPQLGISLRTRTRTLGTLNVALALRGRSSGWGSREHPRRTFVGFHRLNRKIGRHFIEVVVWRGPDHNVVWTHRLNLDRGVAS